MKKPTFITSVFQQETLTKEDYTRVWIDLITALERRKSSLFRHETSVTVHGEKTSIVDGKEMEP